MPFASENAGVMHACGHDAHMAVGRGRPGSFGIIAPNSTGW